MPTAYSVIDDCPVPKPLFPILRKLEKETGANFESIYRGTDVEGLLEKFGKHDQAWLFANLPAGVANPPGRSTHELFSDGVPYPGPVGRKLVWWQCGIDINDADVDAVIEAARRHGWTLFRPYGAGVEFHHVNFAHKPTKWKAFYRAVFKPRTSKKPKGHRPTKLSKHGAQFIAGFEGFRSAAYWDPWGDVWTIGYGHTGDVKEGQRVGRAKALKLLEADAAKGATAVRDLVHVALTQNQFDALVSFVYNLGAGSLAESTLLKKLNKGNYKGAAKEFQKWDHAGGVVLAGLTRRRKAEAALFSKGTR
jgi:lysozyme